MTRGKQRRVARITLLLSGNFEAIGAQMAPRWRGLLRMEPCNYCGQKCRRPRSRTIDHVTPRVHGGRDDWTNLAAACARCNNTKGEMTLLRFLVKRRTQQPPRSGTVLKRDDEGLTR